MKTATYILKVVIEDTTDAKKFGDLMHNTILDSDYIADHYLYVSKLELDRSQFIGRWPGDGVKDVTPNSTDEEVNDWLDRAEKEL